jgi:hypothetical protein
MPPPQTSHPPDAPVQGSPATSRPVDPAAPATKAFDWDIPLLLVNKESRFDLICYAAGRVEGQRTLLWCLARSDCVFIRRRFGTTLRHDAMPTNGKL